MRKVRVKNDGVETVYHLCCRVAGEKDYYPFQDEGLSDQFLKFLEFYSAGYEADLLSFCLMGNHYHIIIRMKNFRKLSQSYLLKKAEAFYPNSDGLIRCWGDEAWSTFEKRLFDVSEFMRSLNRAFTVWFNYEHNCRGRFWADRFKSTILDTPSAIQECMLYVDLNPVRAGIVEKPEDYELSSCYLRVIKEDEFLYDISKLFPSESKRESLKVYMRVLYLRGAITLKRGKFRITNEVYEKALKSEFRTEGIYKKKQKHFVNGVLISTPKKIRKRIERLNNDSPYFKKRGEGVVQETGDVTLQDSQAKKETLE